MENMKKSAKFIILLSSIAFIFILFYSTTVSAIVYPWEYDQEFIFPQETQYHTYYVQRGDSLYSIARNFGISIDTIRRENNIWNNYLITGQRLRIPANNLIIYRVRSGDSLYRIARRFGVLISEIRNSNNLNSTFLYPGQELLIPGKEENNTLTIVVDAGHGGRDPGAVTYHNSELIKESDIAFDISNRLIELLNNSGYNVISTRNGDYNVSLWRRVQIAHQHNADLFVSIHVDNSPSWPGTGGSNVYISSHADQNTYRLAHGVQVNMENSTGRPLNQLGRVLRRPFTVINQSARPSILVETGFLSNWNDLTRFQTAQFRYQIARGIFNGIEEWNR